MYVYLILIWMMVIQGQARNNYKFKGDDVQSPLG